MSHARVAEAIDASGVATSRIRLTTYADGVLTSAWFQIDDASVTDDWHDLYDPTGVVPKVNDPGRTEYVRIDEDWWFVRSFDD